MASAAQARSAPRPNARAAARPVPEARLASPAIRKMFAHSRDQILATVLALVALCLLVALATYNAHDPSLNTATTQATTNLVGPAGALLADLLLQGFGLAGALPGLAMLGWAWRIANHRKLAPGLRIPAMLAGVPVLGAAMALLPMPPGAAWPAAAGPGGAIGQLLAHGLLGAGAGVLGQVGVLLAGAALVALAVLLFVIAFGLTAGEWRAAGAGAARTARASVQHTRSAAGLLARVSAATQAMAAPLGRLVERSHAEPPIEDRFGPAPPLPPRAGIPPLDAARADATPPDYADSAERDDLLPAPRGKPPARAKPAPPRGKPGERQASLRLEEPRAAWKLPSLALLKAPPPRAATGPNRDALEANARLLETVLADYGVEGAINNHRPGPVVTLYELEPAPGIRSARVIGLADDVARSLSVTAVRIATVPGRNVIGIEVPNAKRETVYLSELLSSPEWTGTQSRLTLVLGKDIGGQPVLADLARMPHLLIAGTTGSGKSVGINAMILSLLYRLAPEECRLVLIDPKMLELSVYDGIPHLLCPVVTEPGKAVMALKWTVREMERRYRSMSQLGVRNIGGYNDRVADAQARGEVVTRRVQTGFDQETGKPIFEDQPLALEKLPFIVVVIDEMADLMMVAGKEIEAAVQRLAQMARAAGIHVIMATQRPSVDVITGTIKANFPTRISFQVISKFDSRTILGEQGAEQLLGMGDLLHMMGGGRINRVHGPFVSDREVEDVVAHLRAQGEPAYLEEVTEAQEDDGSQPALSGIAAAGDNEKGLFDQAVAVVAREGKASTSFIQRHLNIGYNRAAKLIEQMEKEGIVGPANHVGRREVLVRRTRDDED